MLSDPQDALSLVNLQPPTTAHPHLHCHPPRLPLPQLGYWEQVLMSPAGLARIGGESGSGGLGRGGVDRVLTLAPGTERLLLTGEEP